MLEALIARYGLLALFTGAALEGETIVIIGGVLTHHGFLTFPAAVAAAASGSFLADQLLFLLGRHLRGNSWVMRRMERPTFKRAIVTFNRHPSAFVFSFRFLYGLRIVSPIAIGTTVLPARRFVPLNAVAAAVWATLFTSLGYFFGQGIEAFFGKLHGVRDLLVLVAAMGLMTIFVRVSLRWLRRKRRA